MTDRPRLYVTGLGTDPTKWKIIQRADLEEDNYVCECETPAQAREIVRRFNAHDALLAACRFAADNISEGHPHEASAVLGQLQNAIEARAANDD